MGVVSLRLKDTQTKYIAKLAKKEGKDKTKVIRELIEYGFDYLMLKEYKEGRISLGKLANELSFSVSETIDLLADYGIKAPIDYEDFLKGYETLKKIF